MFLLEEDDLYLEKTSAGLRDMKTYLFQGPSLHIFVVTNQCNLQCVYCQAQKSGMSTKGFMTEETGIRAAEIALKSPGRYLSFEFQGGEPLLNFSVIKHIIEYTESHRGNKNIEFTIVSNLTLLSDEILNFLLKHHVSICTSLDGPDFIQRHNRKSYGEYDSYARAVSGIRKIRQLGSAPGAIETTTRYSLRYPKEIVAEYVSLGFHSIFIRPLTPLGFALADWNQIGYTADEFLSFYKKCLSYVLALNKKGVRLKEQHAYIFLKKIFNHDGQNYMELRSPCGAGLGQIAYYYDGSIYTCDEARMAAELGNKAFKLGDVYHNTYADLIQNPVCKTVASASTLETIPGCVDCIYQPYCGTCPVVNFILDGNVFPKGINNFRCQIYKGILDYLFELIYGNNPEIVKILHSWIGDDKNEIL